MCGFEGIDVVELLRDAFRRM